VYAALPVPVHVPVPVPGDAAFLQAAPFAEAYEQASSFGSASDEGDGAGSYQFSLAYPPSDPYHAPPLGTDYPTFDSLEFQTLREHTAQAGITTAYL